METDILAETIGKNIMRLRRMANMTQLELAERLNYSDKSVSKWEQGNGVPDVRILVQLADLFQVSVDDLVREHTEKEIVPKHMRNVRRLIIILCSVGLCWLVAVALFVFIGIAAPGLPFLWLAFLYAVPASAIVVLVFSCIWKYKVVRVVSVSVLIWTTLTCIYLTVYACVDWEPMWLIFLLGIPLQVLALFFFVWWKRARFLKR
jgi:transcriptional regulator with XRE-family HTH domain